MHLEFLLMKVKIYHKVTLEKENKIMTLKQIISFVMILPLSLFALIISYQYFYEDYVYGFPPKNAPAIHDKLNETITITNASKQQQQQSSNNKDSLEIDKKIMSSQKYKTTYHFIGSLGSGGWHQELEYEIRDGQFVTANGIAVDSSSGNVVCI